MRGSLKRILLVGGVAAVTLVAGFFSMAALADQPDRNRYIVSFLDEAKGKAALRAAGAIIQLDLPSQGAAAATIPSRALNGLRRNPSIEYIEEDALRFPMAETTPWGIVAVQADLLSEGAAPVKVCIIDSGYDTNHEDLVDLTGGQHAGDPNPLVDTCAHGTHVAGTVAAISGNGLGVVGVVPGKSELIIVQVFNGPDCAWSYSSTLVAALDECKSAGANIVSMSLGGSFKSRTEDRAFGQANNEGILSIAAAGNDGNTRKSYPASYGSVVSVAAVDSTLNVADFSQQNDQVELSAPGVGVKSTVPMGSGLEQDLTVDGGPYTAIAMDGSAHGTGSGSLFECNAVDGLGSPGDCAGATNQVCLISRGDITFAEKVLECQSAGGVAAVIYNNAPELFAGTLGGEVTTIPSVSVSGDDGATLQGLVTTAASVTVNTSNYSVFDGTSMATPHVSGVAALVWSQDSTCSNQDVRNALTSTALDLGAPGRDNAYGYGLVQADDAATLFTSPDFCGSGGGGGGGGSCDLAPIGDACTVDADCCSNKCKGRAGAKTCK